MKTYKKGPIVILFLGAIWILIPLLQLIQGFMNFGKWDERSITKFLQTPLPTDATLLDYTGHTGHAAWLNLSFQASSHSAQIFASNYCEGQLHQNYDPFQAIDTRQPIDGGYKIVMGQNEYYSYAPNIPDTISGIRCLAGSGFSQIQLTLDRSDPQEYVVTIEKRVICNKCHRSSQTQPIRYH